MKFCIKVSEKLSISNKPKSYRQFNFKQADKIPSIQFHTSQQDTRQFNFTQAHKIPSIQFYTSRKRPSIQFQTNRQVTVNSISHKQTRFRQFNLIKVRKIPQFNLTQANKMPSIQFHTSRQDIVNSITYQPPFEKTISEIQFIRVDMIPSIQLQSNYHFKTQYRQFNFIWPDMNLKFNFIRVIISKHNIVLCTCKQVTVNSITFQLPFSDTIP
jgi:hypothetical protein